MTYEQDIVTECEENIHNNIIHMQNTVKFLYNNKNIMQFTTIQFNSINQNYIDLIVQLNKLKTCLSIKYTAKQNAKIQEPYKTTKQCSKISNVFDTIKLC